MTGRRVQVGREVRLVAESMDGVELEGRMRLRPGQLIDLVWSTGAHAGTRRAWVASWRVRELGRDGPTYRGLCRWSEPWGNSYP